MIGKVNFPSAHGGSHQAINVSQNVVVNQQQFVDLGEPVFVGGVFVASHDPAAYLDSDGDGAVDAADPDADVDEPTDAYANQDAFSGDFDDSAESYDDGHDEEPTDG